MKKFKKTLFVPVIDAQGLPISATLAKNSKPMFMPVSSPAWAYFHPNEEVAVINWAHGIEGFDPATCNFDVPITYGGKPLYGNYAWGSSVKGMKTYGLRRDVVRESGKSRKAEDGQRFGREWMSSALYGAGTGNMRIMLMPKGSVVGNHTIGDGCGIMAADFAKSIRNSNIPKIRLGRVNDSFQIAQRFPWETIRDEVTPMIMERLRTMHDPKAWNEVALLENEDKKLGLVELDADMMAHPYITNALSRHTHGMAIKLATTFPMKSYYKVAIPGDEVSEQGDLGLARYPIEAWNNNRSIDNRDKDVSKLKARVAELEAVQYTLTNKMMFAKGISVVVDRAEMPDGVDAILCDEDVKTWIGEKVCNVAVELVDAYLGFLSWWTKGSLVTVPYSTWELMGGDYDGDGCVITHLDNLPKVAEALKAFPTQPALKLPKSQSTWDQGDKRAYMIEKSMRASKIIGMATNALATLYAYSPEFQPIVALRCGFKCVKDMEAALQRLIRIGTDGFKTDVDVLGAEEECTAILTDIGTTAPWTKWKNNALVFDRVMPCFYDPMKGSRVAWDIPSTMDGTVGEILALALPELTEIVKMVRPEAELPMFYRDWAYCEDEDLIADAKSLNSAFGLACKRVDWTDENSSEHLKAWLEEAVTRWQEKSGKDRWELANATWVAVHETQVDTMPTALVFWAFPAEVETIISTKPGLAPEKEKPGAQKKKDYHVTGLQYSFKEMPSVLSTKALVVKIVEEKDGKKILRRVLVTPNLPGQLSAPVGYPAGSIGSFTRDSDVPEEGEYNVELVRIPNQKVWTVNIK